MMNKYEEATGMKKLLALVLALALALPLGVTAFAADAEKIDLSLTGL